MGQIAGAGRAALGEKDARHERPMQASEATGLRAGAAGFALKLADRIPRQVGVIRGDRPIYQPDDDLRPSGRKPHQCAESDQIESVWHRSSGTRLGPSIQQFDKSRNP